MNGTVSYEAATKTVTFDNVEVVVRGVRRILGNENVPGLKIVFTGRNTFKCNLASIWSEKDITLTGDGSLAATTDDEGIGLKGCTCTINGPQLDITTDYPIYDYTYSTLKVNGSST